MTVDVDASLTDGASSDASLEEAMANKQRMHRLNI